MDRRSSGLDVVRLVALVLVVASHYPAAPGENSSTSVQHLGWLGVELFFVLSGLLIGSQWFRPMARGEQPPGIMRFYAKRALRILPAYLLVLAVYVWFPPFRESPRLQPTWQFLTFSQNLIPDEGKWPAFSHAWSLCIEEHFYLFLPLFILVGRGFTARQVARRVAAVLVFGVVVRGVAWTLAVQPWLALPAVDHARPYMMTIYRPTYAQLDGLTLGVALALLSCFRPVLWQRWQRQPWYGAAGGLLVVVLAFVVHEDSGSLADALWTFPVAACGSALIVAALGELRLPGGVWLGRAADLTYAAYLSHKGVIHLTHEGLASFGYNRYSVSSLGITLVAIVGAATLLHLAVERPFLSLRRRV